MAILLTGGAGYIGSHTIIEVIENTDQKVISVDNFSNSTSDAFSRIERITGKKINNYIVDLTNITATKQLFKENSIDGIIHFAALKSVPESVEKPLLYYHNNLTGLINLLKCCSEFKVNKFIFSSSCSVYGNVSKLPVTESTPMGVAESPYAATKQMGEKILSDYTSANKDFKSISLRYFNPVGAHHSGLTGEITYEKPNNLVPIITQVAAGVREKLEVFGNDYNTLDGTCIRDYIHVSDIAKAHILAMELLKNTNKSYEVFNLGTGSGLTVLEIIKAFEKISDKKLNYEISPRRAGDVEAIYANNTKAKTKLGWKLENDIETMMATAWEWQKQILKNQ